jgi:hypothetical protein
MMRTLFRSGHGLGLVFLILMATGCAAVKPVAPTPVAQAPIQEPHVHRELYALNNEGGVMTITNDPCDKQAPPGVKWFHATTETRELATPDGLIHGCWLFAQDYPGIIIHWENGTASVILNPSRLTVRRPESFLKDQPDVEGDV